MTCEECKDWEPITDGPVLAGNNGIQRGRCHCRAPVATPVVMPQINKITQQLIPQVLELTLWSITLPDMYCGEFAKNE